VEPKISNARLSTRRSEAVLNVSGMPAVSISENIFCLFRLVQEDFVERIIDRDYLSAVVLVNDQND